MHSRSFPQALCIIVFLISSCSDSEPTKAGPSRPQVVSHPVVSNPAPSTTTTAPAKSGKRWYAAEHVQQGAPLFAQHCASCHGAAAEGTGDWRQRLPNGHFPPPPLNGNAHAWHHPLRALGHQIKFGAPGGGGLMPKFENTLEDTEILSVIAWFQDHWSDEIYAEWLRRGGLQ